MPAVNRGALAALPADTAGSAVLQLHSLLRHRETLFPLFLEAWRALESGASSIEQEDWAKANLALVNVNAGTGCLTAFWRASRHEAGAGAIAALTATTATAVDICRHAGARAATAVFEVHPETRRRLATSTALSKWRRTLLLLAQRAPESMVAATARMTRLLESGEADAFEDFVAAGLKAAGTDKTRRLAFFSLEDPQALRLLDRAAAGPGFSDAERELKAFLTALWGRAFTLRALEHGDPSPRRSSLAGPVIRIPETYRGVRGEETRPLLRAAAAHASAHLVFGGARFPVGKFKPLQIALTTLIEDARIERLAMQRFPGLCRLWAPYHVAQPDGVKTAPALLARLARALFDPDYEDEDGFVSKGRRLFAEAVQTRADDPASSREIGSLLGNDLGQMRVQFNAKAYVVEPLYRDDGLGLWDFGDDEASQADTLSVSVDAARIEQREQENGTSRQSDPLDSEPAGKARAAAEEEGVIVARYPEWDRLQGVERAEWTTVREASAGSGDARALEEAIAAAGDLRARVVRLVRAARIGRATRLKRQPDGHDLDLDAMLDAGISLRNGQMPDTRIFRATAPTMRDLAVVLLVDASDSTRDRTSSGTVLDIERLAVATLSDAMSALGDPFSLMAFASSGRDDVRITSIKRFDEPYDRTATARLAGVTPGLSTRLGAALRHAGACLDGVRSYRKLVIALSDGEPSDIDTSDPLDLVEDARRAVLGLRSCGIDSFGVILGDAANSGGTIFGRANAMNVRRIEDLPARLSELYFRLARR